MRKLHEEGETLEVEFKRGPVNPDKLAESVVCLANARGGVLFVGIDDDGKVHGFRTPDGSRPKPNHIEAVIAITTVPSASVRCVMLELSGKSVCVVEVTRSDRPMSTTAGVFKRRAWKSDGKPECRPMYFHEMASRMAELGTFDYTAQELPEARTGDLDPLAFERARRSITANAGYADRALLGLSDNDLLLALGLATGEGRKLRLRVAALLLFGRDEALKRFVPTHHLVFQDLRGTSVRAHGRSAASLIQASEEMTSQFTARHREEEFMLGSVRVAVPEYPAVSFREALHNSLVHRDYTRKGEVSVAFRNDRLEISNPGGFLEGIRIDRLLVAAPRARNELIASAFHRLGLVERTGRGIDAIYEGQLRYGRPAPDYSLSTPQEVRVTLNGGDANLELTRFVLEHERGHGLMTVEQLLVVNTIDRERRVDVARVADLIQRDDAAARALLERLVEDGLLEARGERRSRSFGFSASTYRALGNAVGHVRALGIEPIRQREMILSYVRKHGSIVRSDVVELCNLGEESAKRLLRRMVDDGSLRMEGARRSARYVV